jgi:hypothetical protein
MAGKWFDRVAKLMDGVGRGSRRADHPKSHEHRMLRLELLEARSLLSLTVPGFAVPQCVALMGADGVVPLGSASPQGYSPAQIRHAYGFDNIFFNGIAGDGTGTTIAIVDAYDAPNIASDLKQFDKQFGLPDPPSFTKVNQTGGSTMPAPASPSPQSWATEISLDVEWAHAIAPKANILLVEANTASYLDLFAAVDYARNAAGVVAVSMSWGGPEGSDQTTFDSFLTTPGNHAGVTFLVSTGDTGAPASYPATSPTVVAVGGTALHLNGQNNWSSESGWSGSGGGISKYESQPSYQNGVVTQSSTFRTNPDVSYDSDPSTGFSVYDSYDYSSSPWVVFGGTSAAAPQWAALISIADQGRILAGKGSLDGATQTLPMIYGLSNADFHDIVTGGSMGTPHYSATPGYDLVTGRGSPIADLVVRDLVGPSAPSPGPAISSIVIAEATPQNGVLSSTESGVITWALTPTSPVKSYSVMVDGNAISAVYGPYGPYGSSYYYSGVFKPSAGGTHTYAIQATDKAGGVSTTTGSFFVASSGPVISQVVVAEARPKDGVLNSNEQGVITWAVTSSYPIVNRSLKVDNVPATANFGPYGPFSGDYYYSGLFGTASAGTHAFTIRATDSKGATNVYNGIFTVAPSSNIKSNLAGSFAAMAAAQLRPMIAQSDRQLAATQTAQTGMEGYRVLPYAAGLTNDGSSDSHTPAPVDNAVPVQCVDLPAAVAYGMSQALDEAHSDLHGSTVLGGHSLFGDDALLPMPGDDLNLASDRTIDSQVVDRVFASVSDAAV